MLKFVQATLIENLTNDNGEAFTKVYFDAPKARAEETSDRRLTAYVSESGAVYFGHDVVYYLVDLLGIPADQAFEACAEHHAAPFSWMHSDFELMDMLEALGFGTKFTSLIYLMANFANTSCGFPGTQCPSDAKIIAASAEHEYKCTYLKRSDRKAYKAYRRATRKAARHEDPVADIALAYEMRKADAKYNKAMSKLMSKREQKAKAAS